MTAYFRTFDYMKQFQCIGPDCEDTCCHGWKVNLYRKDYKKITKLLDSDPQLSRFRPCLKTNPKEERFDANWGYLDFGQSGGCGMMEDGWCVLHRDHGEKYLPTVCATFPRLIYEFRGGWEVHGRLSCPEVARLCLLSPTLPALEDDEKGSLPEIYETNPWAREKGGFYKQYLENVSETIRLLLYRTGFSNAERIYFVLFLNRKIEPFYYMGVAKDPGSRLERILARFKEETFLKRTAEHFSRLQPDKRVGDLVLAIANARLKGDNFKRYNDLFTEVLKSFASDDGRLAREGIIDGNVNTHAVWAAYQARQQHIMARYGACVERYFLNFSVNFWSQLLFVGDADLMVPTRKYLVYLVMIRFLFFSHPKMLKLIQEQTSLADAQPVLDETIVAVVQIFMKNIDANYHMLKSFISSMESLAITDLNGLAAMLKT